MVFCRTAITTHQEALSTTTLGMEHCYSCPRLIITPGGAETETNRRKRIGCGKNSNVSDLVPIGDRVFLHDLECRHVKVEYLYRVL